MYSMDRRATPEYRDLPERRGIQVHKAHKVTKAILEPLVHRDLKVTRENKAMMELLLKYVFLLAIKVQLFATTVPLILKSISCWLTCRDIPPFPLSWSMVRLFP